jgi:hypothetical protein
LSAVACPLFSAVCGRSKPRQILPADWDASRASASPALTDAELAQVACNIDAAMFVGDTIRPVKAARPGRPGDR